MDIDGKIQNRVFHFNRLKEACVRTTKGLVNMQADLKQTLNLGIGIN